MPDLSLFQFYIDPAKLLPLQRFLPKPPGSVQKRGGGRGGGRGGFRGIVIRTMQKITITNGPSIQKQ